MSDLLSYEVSFNGNVELQCQNGTYPECRHLVERQLERAVSLGHMTEEDARAKMKANDDLWNRYKKTPDVKEKFEARKAIRAEQEDAIIAACEGTLSELRGEEVKLVIVGEKRLEKEEDDGSKDNVGIGAHRERTEDEEVKKTAEEVK